MRTPDDPALAESLDVAPALHTRLLVPGALAVVLAYLCTAPGYGYFRDEFYYLACGQHLALGYVDHPPLIGLVAGLVRATLGTSLYAIRLVPALAAGVLFWLAGACSAALGGTRYAQLMAAACLSLAPLTVALCSFLSMNSLELVFWGLVFWLTLLQLRAARSARWLALGLTLGLALENKISTLSLTLGLALALLLCRRDLLRTRGPYLTAAIALALFLPHVIWQIRAGFPVLEFIHNARTLKMQPQSVSGFMSALVLYQNPVATPVSLLGLVTLLRSSSARPIAVAVLGVLGLFIVGDGKPYYAAPLFLPLFAAGACALERIPKLRVLALFLVVTIGVILMPLAKPLLPVARFIDYQAALGLAPQGVGERHRLGALPQVYADMFGWRELVDDVAAVHRTLSPDERARACVLTENYGQAGAIDLLGPARGLPPAISGHNSYWLWGPRGCTGETVIVVGRRREDLLDLFREVKLLSVHHCELCMPFENDKPIYVAAGARIPMRELWLQLKHYE